MEFLTSVMKRDVLIAGLIRTKEQDKRLGDMKCTSIGCRGQ